MPGVDKVIGKSEERRYNCAVCDEECQNFPVAETGLGFSSQDECCWEILSTAGDVDISRVRILHEHTFS